MHSSAQPARARLRLARAAGLLATSALSAWAAPVSAQTLSNTERQAPDENGVDVISGQINVPVRSITAGRPGDGGLTYANGWSGGEYFDTFGVMLSGVAIIPQDIQLTIYGISKTFTYNGDGTWTTAEGDGSTFVHDTSAGAYIYTASDGTKFTFLTSLANTGPNRNPAPISTITRPDGEVITYHHLLKNGSIHCTSSVDCTTVFAGDRIQSVTSSRGYEIKANYATSTWKTDGTSNAEWARLTQVTAINNAVDYCDPLADSCTLTKDWPTLTLGTSTSGSTTTDTFTDRASNTTTVTSGASGLLTLRSPANTANDLTITYDANGRVATYAYGGGSWGYSYADSTVGGVNERTTTVTQPLGGTKVYVSDLDQKRVLSFRNELNQTISYAYDSYARLAKTTYPEGNYLQLTYDDRGNVTERRQVSKAPSAPADIVTTAGFPATCTNPLTCNEPTWTRDANGNETDYTYDASTGQLLSATSPAPTTGAVRPQTRYSYSSLYAYFKNSAGSIVAAPTPVSVLTGISSCQTLSSCSGTVDETMVSIVHGSTGVANNLAVTSLTAGSGTGALSVTTGYGYDVFGNVVTIDGPLPGTADTTTYKYDGIQRLVGVISADPDGAGSLLRRAQKLTYDGNGNVTESEVGTVAGTDDASWAAFASKQQLVTSYDGYGRKIRDVATAGGTKYGVTDYSYDSAGRPDCTAVRMNATIWGLVTAACTAQTAGSAGPDRITKTGYDPAGRANALTTAYGQTYASTESMAYNANGTTASVTDAENNKTTYLYDGFDRLSKTEYPSPTKGAGTSSTTDYEQLGYDADGNVTSRRLRDGTSITYGYDHLNRLVSKDLPGSEPDVTYGYDLLGRPTSVSQTGSALSFTYDALSRLLTETGPQGTMTSTWDAGGRRTKLQWPDTFYVNYDYDLLGEMTAVRENGAASGVGVLASYAYDDLGNRTSATFGNGTTSTWTPDAVSRLGTLTHNLAGTTYDLTKTFGYNPASQIASSTSSNDAYAWNAAANTNRNYTPNGLNQYTASGTTSLGYDVRGNLTTSGSDSYGYSSENLMTTGPGGTSLAYDPLLRLDQVTQGSTTTRFGYDGLEMVAEYNAANALQKRYVFGPGTDEPIVQYTGTGTTSRNWLMADERGSVIALSDGSGNEVAVNSYDEYGIPGSANSGRFQYTGQTWLPEIGMYYYKARMYSPSLGRFMQTDPIGYADGLNWYNYVGGDPINFVDPMGLARGVVPGPSIGSTCQVELSDDGKRILFVYSCTDDPAPGQTVVTAHQGSGGSLPSYGGGDEQLGGNGIGTGVAVPQNKPPANDLHKYPGDEKCTTRACIQSHIPHDVKCKAISDFGRVATYGGGASWVATLLKANPWTAAISGGITVIGVLNQIDSDVEGC